MYIVVVEKHVIGVCVAMGRGRDITIGKGQGLLVVVSLRLVPVDGIDISLSACFFLSSLARSFKASRVTGQGARKRKRE